MELHSFSFSTKGGREENQDTIALREDKYGAIYLLADGLGGMQKGKLASETVVKVFAEDWPPKEECELKHWLEERFAAANQKLLARCCAENAQMRSTLVALVLRDNLAAWAHSGDSRFYYMRDGRIKHITEDHSVSYRRFKAGEISRADLATDPDQSALLRVLGKEERWEPDTAQCELSSGDAFLLCSDGLWEYVQDDEILFDLLKAHTAREWAERLLVRAMARIKSGNDNLSLLTVMVE